MVKRSNFFAMRWWIAPAMLAALIIVAPGLAGSPQTPAASGWVTNAAPIRTFSLWQDESAVRATSKVRWAAIARHNSVIVLNSWDYWLIPLLKRANPQVQVWMYKDLSGIRSDDCTSAGGGCGSCLHGVMDSKYLSSGMGYCWVRRYRPGWLLTAAGTKRPFEFRGYPRIWETDYGNRAYQRRWIRNVLADVRARGWDGVRIDNALTTANAYGVAAKYPTDAAVQAATYSALRTISGALHRVGIPAVFNVGYVTRFPGLWNRWLTPVDGLEQEFYLSHSQQPNALGHAWGAYQAEVAACAARHKTCWFHSGSYSPTVSARTRVYALASFLLATDGRQLLAVGDTAHTPRAPCRQLGRPAGPARRTGRVWQRRFTGGIAVVNPGRFPASVSLGGTYLDRRRAAESAVTLNPASGAVVAAPHHGACG